MTFVNNNEDVRALVGKHLPPRRNGSSTPSSPAPPDLKDDDVRFQAEVAADREAAVLGAAEVHRRRVAAELKTLRVRDDARRQLAAEKAAAASDRFPEAVTLTKMLAVPDEATKYRIEGLWPIGGRVLLAAQYKAGKSTMVANLLRALVDGGDFLGRFRTERVERVALIDNELDERMLRHWLREQGIRNTDAVTVISLRGRVSAFDIVDHETRSRWAKLLTGVNVLIVDCLRPILDALGLDENHDAGRLLVAFDELLDEAGIDEANLVHHMGHSGERSRGDSRLLDWPDVPWKVVRENDDPTSPRYFSAYGRGVDVREGKLDYTPETRELTYVDGDRRHAAGSAALTDLTDLLGAAPDGLSGRALEAALMERGHGRQAARSSVKLAAQEGLTCTSEGPRNATLHHLNPASVPVRQSALPVRRRDGFECASAPVYGALHSGNSSGTPARHVGILDEERQDLGRRT